MSGKTKTTDSGITESEEQEMAAHKKAEQDKMVRTLITVDRKTKALWFKAAKRAKKNASAWIRELIKKAVEQE